jgi:hypothetical protein
LARTEPDLDLEASVLEALAVAYFATLGDHVDALSYAVQALAAYERLQDEPHIIQVLLLIARIHTRSGDPEKALLQYQRALSLMTDAGHVEAQTELFIALGVHFRPLGSMKLRSNIMNVPPATANASPASITVTDSYRLAWQVSMLRRA